MVIIDVFSFSLSFKTQADGALVVSHGNGATGADLQQMTDHIVIEIVGGNVHFDVDAGTDSGGAFGNTQATQASTVSITSSITVTDNQWHHVTATRTGPEAISLSVDDVTQTATGTGHFVSIDINIPTYLGGHPSFDASGTPATPTPGLQSTTHFIGCITDVRYSLDFGAIRHLGSLDGHYEVVPQPMPYQAARQYCQQNDYDLASIHSSQEQQFAADQCAKFTQRARSSTTSGNYTNIPHYSLTSRKISERLLVVQSASTRFRMVTSTWLLVLGSLTQRSGSSLAASSPRWTAPPRLVTHTRMNRPT